MGREDVIKILTVLQTAYPMFYRGQTNEQLRDTAQLWLKMFGDKDATLVENAVIALISTRAETYPPSIGSVNEMIQKITTPEINPLDAWGYVKRAIRNGTYGAEEEWERLPEAVKTAITPQQIRSWATDEDFNEGVASSLFMKSFQAKQKSDREQGMLPESIRNMVLLATEKLNKPTTKPMIEQRKELT